MALQRRNNHIRIGNARGLKQEDFDNIFPWSEIKKCVLKIDQGEKTVLYEDEAGYAEDGSAGNVMVEIPAFFIRRERDKNVERWMISDKKLNGFEVHPWLINEDGSIEKYRYYGAYLASENNDDIWSASGKMLQLYSQKH